MIALGLTAADQAAFHRALTSSHQIRVIVQILTLSHAVVATVSDRLLEGSVSVDTSGEVDRTATLTLLDPNRSLSLDSADPAKGAAFADNLVRIQYGVRVDEINRWVWVPIFTGPVTKVARNDVLVQVEASGKELLAQGAFWRVASWPKGTNKAALLRSILALTGETAAYMDVPVSGAKQPGVTSLSQLSIAWSVCQDIARGMAQQLFYDGRGIARMRTWPGTTSWTFKGGEKGSLSTYPSVDFATDDVRNVVWVKGAKPAGAARAIEVVKAPPATHPLAPSRIGRNGYGRYLPEVIEDDTITSNAAAETLATAKVNEMVRETYSLAFEALPVPHLEPGDMVALVTDEFSGAHRLTAFTIPLTPGLMSVGFTKTVSRPQAVVNRIGAATADRINALNLRIAANSTAQKAARARYDATKGGSRKRRQRARQALMRARAATARSRADLRSAKNTLQKSKWTRPW